MASYTRNLLVRSVWGFVSVHSPAMDAWVGIWHALEPRGPASVEIDGDSPENNVNRATYQRARRALGRPRKILVLDEATAAMVRRVVPDDVPVVVEDVAELRAHIEAWSKAPPDDDLYDVLDELDDDELEDDELGPPLAG